MPCWPLSPLRFGASSSISVRAPIERIAACFYQPFISVLWNKIKCRKARGGYFFPPAALLAGLWIVSRDWNSRAKNRIVSSWHARWAWPANFPGGTRLGAAAFSELSLDSQACGVAVFKVDWSDTGGYTYPRRAIPVFFFPSSRWHSPPIRRTIELLHRN